MKTVPKDIAQELQRARLSAEIALTIAQGKYPDAKLIKRAIDEIWDVYELNQKPDFANRIERDKHFDIVGRAGEYSSLTQKLSTLKVQIADLEQALRIAREAELMLRDQFAMAAMSSSCWHDGKEVDIAESAYKQADAMLEARKAK